jgi:hypothetical protein
MNKFARIAAIGSFVLLFAQSAVAQAPSRPFLTGKWEGIMTAVGANPDGSTSVVPPMQEGAGQYGFRLDIRGDNLVMHFQVAADQWQAVGEGADLRLNDVGRSAIVIAGLGAEAMMLNITRWDEDSIVVHMSRVPATPDGQIVNSMGSLTKADF